MTASVRSAEVEVAVLGIRHHGPGSARSLLAALNEFGPDALRYFIAVAGPENQDSDFTWDEFVRRNNFELANEWGNLVNRSVSMAHKNNGQCLPPDVARDPAQAHPP